MTRTKIIQNIKVHKKNLSTPIVKKLPPHLSRSQQQRAIDWFDLSKSYWGHNPIMIRLHGGPNVATWILVDRLRDIVWPNRVTMLHGISAMSNCPKSKSLGNLLDVKQKSRWVGPIHYNYNNSSFFKTNIFSIWLNS